MDNKTVEIDVRLINEEIGVIMGMSFLHDDENCTLNISAYNLMKLIGDENIDYKVIRKNIEQTVKKHIETNGMDNIIDKITKEYKINLNE